MLVFLGEMTIWRLQEFHPRFGLELVSMNLCFSTAPSIAIQFVRVTV